MLNKATVDFIVEQNALLKDDLKNAMADQATAISARVDDKIEIKMNSVERKIDSIVDHNERQNGWIKDHKLRLDAVELDTEELQGKCMTFERHINLWKWVGRRWYFAAALFIGLVLGTAWLYHNMNFVKTLENTTGVKLIEDEAQGPNE